MHPQLCCCGKTQERLKRTEFWPAVKIEAFPRLPQSTTADRSKAGWLADVHHTPLHMQTPALRASYSYWKRNSLSDFLRSTFPPIPSKTKQFLPHCFKELWQTGKCPHEQRILVMVCMWFMQLIDFSRCMLLCLLRGNYHFEALCVKNQRMLDTKCPVPTEPKLGTRHNIDIPVGVGQLGTEPTPNKCWARCSIWISTVWFKPPIFCPSRLTM